MDIRYFLKESGRSPVREFINSLPPKDQTRVTRTIGFLRDYGLNLGMPYLKSLTGIKGAWELRVKSGSSIYRFGLTTTGRVAIIVHGFTKKSNKTEKKDLEIIKGRVKEIK